MGGGGSVRVREREVGRRRCWWSVGVGESVTLQGKRTVQNSYSFSQMYLSIYNTSPELIGNYM